MDRLVNLVTKQKPHHMLLCLVMVVFVVFNIEVPSSMANLVDSVVGRIVLAVLVVYLFMQDPTVGAIGVIAAYTLLTRAEVSTGTYAVNNYVPSERIKGVEFTAWNQFPETLEEQIVKKMAPHGGDLLAPPSFKPLMDKTDNASKLD